MGVSHGGERKPVGGPLFDRFGNTPGTPAHEQHGFGSAVHELFQEAGKIHGSHLFPIFIQQNADTSCFHVLQNNLCLSFHEAVGRQVFPPGGWLVFRYPEWAVSVQAFHVLTHGLAQPQRFGFAHAKQLDFHHIRMQTGVKIRTISLTDRFLVWFLMR